MNETIVVFRKDVTGEPFALFPELPSDIYGQSARPPSRSTQFRRLRPLYRP